MLAAQKFGGKILAWHDLSVKWEWKGINFSSKNYYPFRKWHQTCDLLHAWVPSPSRWDAGDIILRNNLENKSHQSIILALKLWHCDLRSSATVLCASVSLLEKAGCFRFKEAHFFENAKGWKAIGWVAWAGNGGMMAQGGQPSPSPALTACRVFAVRSIMHHSLLSLETFKQPWKYPHSGLILSSLNFYLS